MTRPASTVFARAWRYYRRYGLRRLLRTSSSELYRVIPFRYRLASRKRLSQLKYGPAAVTRPLAVHWISPDRVRRNGPIFGHDRYIATVRAGDWDRDPTRLVDEEMYVGLTERFVDGDDWEDTRYYALAERNFEADGEWLGYTSFESFVDHRLPYLDRMYEDIRRNGYRTQAELDSDARDERRHGSVPDHHDRINEIACNVARDGELLLNNGIHRITIAKALALDEIPVQFIVRHEDWQSIRQAVAGSDRPRRTAREHDVETTHPDLQRLCASTGGRGPSTEDLAGAPRSSNGVER